MNAEIDYRGEKIRLAKNYVSYDAYKNDPRNLDPSQIARVEKIITEARIGPNIADWKDFVSQAFKIKFPGYGIGPGPRVASGDRKFVTYKIEIPQVCKDRYFILEELPNGSLQLVDDFVMASVPSNIQQKGLVRRIVLWMLFPLTAGRPLALPAISSISLVDCRLIYLDQNSKVVREKGVGDMPNAGRA